MDEEKFLAELGKSYVGSASKAFLNKVNKFWRKLKYGVTIKEEESNSIKKISESSFFLIFKTYLGNHWSKDLIKVGLYVSQLNEEGHKERIKELSDEAYRNERYGKRGWRIIQFASTGVLEIVMQHIIDLKHNKDATKRDLQREFDKILDEWEKISIPVSSEMNQKMIKDVILKKMSNDYPIFFVYAASHASNTAMLTIAKMRNDHLFSGKYFPFPKHKQICDIDYCLWVFEKVQVTKETLISKQIKK